VKRHLFTSESVTEGHPDKLCDSISDAILDALLTKDRMSRVACETAATTGVVFVAGEITTKASIDYQDVVRGAIREIGYTGGKFGFDSDTCGVIVAMDKQSPDIDMGVSQALEARQKREKDCGKGEDDACDAQGAGDQGMVFGYACNETKELMPMPISLAHKLTNQLTDVRKKGILPFLGPDGKAKVTVIYEDGKPVGIDTVLISTQHTADVSDKQIRDGLSKSVIGKVIPKSMMSSNTRVLVNPTGRFVVGGPVGDTGLTGRKIIVDTYGGYARHGGGAFSGKDPSKVDRSGTYMARYAAKNIVASGAAAQCEIQISYAIGVAKPVSIFIETFGTETVPIEKIEKAALDVFDFRPLAIINTLKLRRPIYSLTSNYGHFGRELPEFVWEKTDKAAKLKKALGIK